MQVAVLGRTVEVKHGSQKVGSEFMVSARVKISWPKYGISVAALALLKSMAVCSVPPATGTPKRVPKYLATSNLKSKSSTRNSPSPGEKLKLFVGSSRSMIVAP